jgi:hypothetical protein
VKREPSERDKLLSVAKTAAECQYARHYPGIEVDVSYLDSASDERLRTIVRAWYRTDDIDALLAGPVYAA